MQALVYVHMQGEMRGLYKGGTPGRQEMGKAEVKKKRVPETETLNPH